MKYSAVALRSLRRFPIAVPFPKRDSIRTLGTPQNEIQAMQNEIHAHTEKINEQNQVETVGQN